MVPDCADCFRVQFLSTLFCLSVPVAPPVIEMKQPSRVILVRNQSLFLSCNTTNVNGEITLKWVIPPGSVRPVCFSFATEMHWNVSISKNGFSSLWEQSVFLLSFLLSVQMCKRGTVHSACAWKSWLFVYLVDCICEMHCLCMLACRNLYVSVSVCLARIDMHPGLISGDLWALTGCRLVSTATSKGWWRFTYPDGGLHSCTQCHTENSGSMSRRYWKLQMRS